MATSLASRKFDLFLAIFLTIHGFCVTFIDCLDLYPTSLQPAILQHVRHFYIETFQDRFMTEPPRWFVALTWFELLYHLPTCLWSIPALVRDDPLVPLYLILWAMQCFVSTLVCVVDILSWEDRSSEVKAGLVRLYGPYLVISSVVFVVMYRRLRGALLQPGKDRAKTQ